MNVRSENIPMSSGCVAAKKFVFNEVPIVNALKPVDSLEVICYLNKRLDGSYWASICPQAYNGKGKPLGYNGKPYNTETKDESISWERLLKCETLRKNDLFKELFILHEFDDCRGMCHDGFSEDGKYIPDIDYVLTDATVNKLLDIIK